MRHRLPGAAARAVDRIDSKSEEPVELAAERFTLERTFPDQIPVEGFKMADVKDDPVALWDRSIEEGLWADDAKQLGDQAGGVCGLPPASSRAALERCHRLSWRQPISEITNRTGTWTLRLLLVTLAVTPVRRLSGWNDAIRLRRMLGLFAFFYAALHFSTYLVLDQFFDVAQIAKDIAKWPFIAAGSLAFVFLIPLAATSTAGVIRRLGGKRWRQLHRLVYVSAAAGVVHYLWLVKAGR